MNWLQSLFFNNNDEPMKISRIEIEGDFEFYQEDDTLKIRTVGSVEPPPAPETIEVRLRGDGSIMRFYKAPDSVDVINFEYWQDDPVMIEVKIIDSTWGFAPIQMMKKVNGNDRKVHTDWNKVGWDAEVSFAYLDQTTDARISFRRGDTSNWSTGASKYINGGGFSVIDG